MTRTISIADLRARHHSFGALPDTIIIPATGLRRETIVKAVEDATLDDLAFALLAMETEFNAAANRMHALKKLYGLARQAGALGVDRAALVVATDPSVTSG